MLDFNSHHFTDGSENPLNKDGATTKVTLINQRFCPFAHRVALIVVAKNIACDVINVHLKKKPDWFLAANPLGLVPVLVLNDKSVICESDVCAEFLDEAFQGELRSADPLQRAKDKSLTVFATKAIPALMTLNKTRPEEREKYRESLQSLKFNASKIQSDLRKKGTKYFGGDSGPGMVDYMIWPLLERFPATVKNNPEAELDPEEFRDLIRWRERMLEDSVVRRLLIPDEIHAEFLGNTRNGIFDYDGMCGKIINHIN